MFYADIVERWREDYNSNIQQSHLYGTTDRNGEAY